jgi:hypothetical protein
MKLNLKLGEKPGDSGIQMPVSTGDKEQEEYFPEFTFREAGEPEFPESGTMVIKYNKVRTSYDKKSKKPYQCTIEVKEIVSANGEKGVEAPAKSDRTTEDALDGLLKKKQKESNPGEEY